MSYTAPIGYTPTQVKYGEHNARKLMRIVSPGQLAYNPSNHPQRPKEL